jgi:chaperonin GroEL (HSP60 family)
MKILSSREPIDVFLDASSILNKAVEHTLGPEGSNTAVHTQNFYSIINDGKSIIEPLSSLDAEIAPALETLKQASFETNRKAGDGTTSTIVLMNQLLKGVKDELSVATPVDIANKLLQVEEKLQELIRDNKITIDNRLYENITKVSLRVISLF